MIIRKYYQYKRNDFTNCQQENVFKTSVQDIIENKLSLEIVVEMLLSKLIEAS